jgi:hypothetical protein
VAGYQPSDVRPIFTQSWISSVAIDLLVAALIVGFFLLQLLGFIPSGGVYSVYPALAYSMYVIYRSLAQPPKKVKTIRFYEDRMEFSGWFRFRKRRHAYRDVSRLALTQKRTVFSHKDVIVFSINDDKELSFSFKNLKNEEWGTNLYSWLSQKARR